MVKYAALTLKEMGTYVEENETETCDLKQLVHCDGDEQEQRDTENQTLAYQRTRL